MLMSIACQLQLWRNILSVSVKIYKFHNSETYFAELMKLLENMYSGLFSNFYLNLEQEAIVWIAFEFLLLIVFCNYIRS